MTGIFVAMAIQNHYINVKGSKYRFRDFICIDDAVEPILCSLKNQKVYDVLNICSSIPTRVEEIIDAITTHLPYKIEVEYSGGTPGDQFGIYGDNSKIRSAIG